MKKILVANFFPAFNPPMSGGELKVLKYYTELSRHFHIDLVTFTYPTRSETIRHTDSFFEHRVAKPAKWARLWARVNAQGYNGELSGVVSELIARGASQFRETMLRYWDDADIVMYDFPFVFPHDPFPQDQSKVRIYNSHNFEAALSWALVSGGGSELHDMVERSEEALCRSSDLIIATSALEAQAFSLFYQIPQSRIEVMPLGFEPQDVTAEPKEDINNDSFCFFIGSQHGPNLQAGREVVDLAVMMPDIRFVIAGAVCDALEPAPDNVVLMGRVDDNTKCQLFSDAAVFLNPMREGAGMNVKVVEALGAGLPVISTGTGARGFNLGDEHLAVAETLSEFEAALRRFLGIPADQAKEQKRVRAALAEEQYSWAALADKSAQWIASLDTRQNYEELSPINLFINDFPIGDGAAGGQKRMLDLISNIPSPYPKVLLTLTDGASIQMTLRDPDFVEVNIPKSAEQRAFGSQMGQWNVMSIDDVAAGMFVKENPLYVRWFRRLARRAINISFEHCYMSPVLDAMPEDASPRIVYSSYNVEADLKQDMLNLYRHTHKVQVAEAVREIERFCATRADVVLAVTSQDAARLQDLYGLSTLPSVIVNGTRVPGEPIAEKRRAPAPEKILKLLFIGSAHPPNTTAVETFIETVLPLLDNVELTVVGSVGDAIKKHDMPDNVTFTGRVSETEKQNLLDMAHIAVNPQTIGGGSSLKVGDYLCAGLPVVTTKVGIRGFDLKDNDMVLMAEMGAPFAAAVNRLRDEPETYVHIARTGQAYARDALDWRRLGEEVATLYAKSPPTLPAPHNPSVLVVTYRYTEPRRGGAEEYLYKVLDHMSRQGMTIDLVTLDIEEIVNAHGMVCRATGTASEAPIYAPFARNVRYFQMDDHTKIDPITVAAELQENAQRDSDQISDNCRELASGNMLLSGWHHAEITAQGVARWTDKSATLLVAQPVQEIRISGSMPDARLLEILVDGDERLAVNLDSAFSFSSPLRANPGSVITLRVSSAARIGEDVRVLGLYINELGLFDGTSWFEISLQNALPEYVAQNHLDRFMNEVLDLAQHRDDSLNDLYQIARGLRSSEALEYIEKVATSYDHVLVHGIQFAFIQDLANLLDRIAKPFTLVPHMHLDDTFYHWAPLYDCIAKAHNVICPENSHYNTFLSRLNENIVNTPGGGIDPNEFLLSGNAINGTLETYNLAGKDFFLILGRKSPAKHYRKIISAFAKAEMAERAELIIVGPDEDGFPIDEPGTRYLGALPRQDVIALLKGCTALISMSESESFGIVLAEAWACGKPVVANSGCAVFRDIVDNGKDGFLVSDVVELSARMAELLETPELCDRMGTAGREKALRCFGWHRIANTIRNALV